MPTALLTEHGLRPSRFLTRTLRHFQLVVAAPAADDIDGRHSGFLLDRRGTIHNQEILVAVLNGLELVETGAIGKQRDEERKMDQEVNRMWERAKKWSKKKGKY